MGPNEPPMTTEGSETVRSLGGLWTLGEGTMGEGDCGGVSIMTLGYNPQLKRFVGSFVASVMTHFWPYEGMLDADRKILALDSSGPCFSGDGTILKYQDRIEFIDDDHRTLTAFQQLPSGEWRQFMTTHYYRVVG